MVTEEQETPLDEARETPEVQAQEQADGTEQQDSVPLTEDFQRSALELLKDATNEQCSFLQSMCSKRMSELYDQESDSVSADDYEKVKSNE